MNIFAALLGYLLVFVTVLALGALWAAVVGLLNVIIKLGWWLGWISKETGD